MGMRRNRLFQEQQGITLGEVLFIAALTLLGAGILLFVGTRTNQEAFHKGCASNIRALGEALVMYAQDHDDGLPPYATIESKASENSASRGSSSPATTSLLKQALHIYVGEAAWYCPADRDAKRNVYCLGVHHEGTSYAIPDFRRRGTAVQKLSTLPSDFDHGLVWDAAGDRNSCSPDAWRAGAAAWATNHSDGLVNYILPDLSLHRELAFGRRGLLP
jgi:hypothetical protein